VVLAFYASEYSYPEHAVHVYSVEQNEAEKERIEKRLTSLGLARYVTIFYAPVSDEGKYGTDVTAIDNELGNKKIDWLIIDGPASDLDGVRHWTLPQLAAFCGPATKWFLDDALRDGELAALKRWIGIPGVSVEGVYMAGKGLAAGTIEGPKAIGR
jgi:hypothetical protein